MNASNSERVTDPTESFERLLGRQATAEEKANLLRVRDVLNLRNNDSLWLILLALESYDARFREYPQRIREELERSAKDLQHVIRSASQEALTHARHSQVVEGPFTDIASAWRAALATYAGLVVFGAICLTAGFNLARRGQPTPWLIAGGGTSSPLGRIASMLLRAPAGWMAFVLLLPALLTGARAGWRASRELANKPLERLAGLAVLGGCTLAGIAALVILLGLL